MRYDFLIETYETERLKVISAWSMFTDADLSVRPHPTDPRGRSVHEHMVHQCVSEDTWFRTMLGIDVGLASGFSPLPQEELRLEFMRRYSEDSGARLSALRRTEEPWWEAETQFFDVRRSRAWVFTRRLNHTAHHRGQLLALLRVVGRDEYSTYGPTADTGGLMRDHASTIYAYPALDAMLQASGKTPLPAPSGKPVTERPSAPATAPQS